MAKTVYDVQEIELQDGTEVTLKPLNIKGLRKFNDVFKRFKEDNVVDDEDASISILMDLAIICLTKDYPDLASDKEKLEDVLDIDTVYKILEVCGGLDLKAMNAQALALLQNQQG